MFGIKQKKYLSSLNKWSSSWWTIHVIGMDLREGTFAKVGHNISYASRGLHCRNHIAVSNFHRTYINSWNILQNLVNTSFAAPNNWGYILKNYKSYFGKFVWKNRSVSKFRGEFPLPFSILINMILYKSIWSYQSFYYIYRVFKIILEGYEQFWNKVEVITFVIT